MYHQIKHILYTDTGLILIDDHRSMGPERRKVLDHAILQGTKTYRDALQEMWNSVHISWDEAWAEYLDRAYIRFSTDYYVLPRLTFSLL